jgi:hypothetical protein
MKVAITGHSRGIGSALTSELSKRGHLVLGFSRANGYDIADVQSRTDIIQQANDCDVFINNAYSHIAQFDLLEKITTQWQEQKKIVINVNSKSIFAPEVPQSMQQYVEDKRRQYDYIQSLKFRSRPYVMDLILGLVDTEMSDMFIADKMKASEIAQLIADILERKDQLYVQQLILDVPFQDWKNIQQKNQ